MELLIEKIRKGLVDLPGEEAHIEMVPFRPTTSDVLKTANDYRISAVMALLYPGKSGTSFLLIERPKYNGTHSGQIAFPGGKMEEVDLAPVDAALRETHEEVGIESKKIEVLGQLSDVYIPVSKFLVHPFVGFMDHQPQLILDPREVESVVEFSVDQLLDPSTRSLTEINTSKGYKMKDIPCFKAGDKIIWGATALMLNELKQILR